MSTHKKGRPLPKFGEWEVNNPASADGFTVIFAKARDEKAKGSNGGNEQPGHTDSTAHQDHYRFPLARRAGFVVSET